MNKTLYLPTVLGISLLSGCVDSSIDIVKKTETHDSKHTYGQIYDNRKMCDSIQWAAEKQNDDETTVTSTCTFKLSGDQLQKSRQLAISQANEYYDIFSRSYDQTTEAIKEKIETIEQTPNITNFDSWIESSSSIEEAIASLKHARERKEKFGKNSSYEMEAAEYEIERATRKLEEAKKHEEYSFKSLNDELKELKEKLSRHTTIVKTEIYSELDRLKSADLAQVEEILGENITATQSVYFQVINNRAELKTMDLVFADRKAPLNYDDITYLATEQIAPNNTNFLSKWDEWAAAKARTVISYSVKNPTYSCGKDRLGIECKKAE